jgi:hypothetical protein
MRAKLLARRAYNLSRYEDAVVLEVNDLNRMVWRKILDDHEEILYSKRIKDRPLVWRPQTK